MYFYIGFVTIQTYYKDGRKVSHQTKQKKRLLDAICASKQHTPNASAHITPNPQSQLHGYTCARKALEVDECSHDHNQTTNTEVICFGFHE